MKLADWTLGGEGIVYQDCPACRARGYFARDFCPKCGAAAPTGIQASGRGHVYAVTQVNRAPSDALRAAVPYTIVLVDAVEGFRLMGHGAPSLKIGDPVRAGFILFDGKRVPFFAPG